MHVLVFIAVLFAVVVFVQIGLLSIAFDKLGLSAPGALMLLLASLAGSYVNLPLLTVAADPPEPGLLEKYARRGLLVPAGFRPGHTLIAVNLGGCLIPVFFCLYLLASTEIGVGALLLGVAVVAAVCRLVSRPIPGFGIGMPVLVAPLAAALVGVSLAPAASAPLAYVAGTLGVLIGADLMRLEDIRRMGAPMAAIGGAGTYDGIFITGIVAALLA